MPQKCAEIQQMFCCAFCMSLPSNKSTFDGWLPTGKGKENLTFSHVFQKMVLLSGSMH